MLFLYKYKMLWSASDTVLISYLSFSNKAIGKSASFLSREECKKVFFVYFFCRGERKQGQTGMNKKIVASPKQITKKRSEKFSSEIKKEMTAGNHRENCAENKA